MPNQEKAAARKRCSINGCKARLYGREWCEKHYKRNYRHGSPNTVKNPVTLHGGSGTDEYVCWGRMKDRCLNPNEDIFPYYGGRGINICKRWRTSFVNFLSDMGRKPSKGHSIDRIDVNGNYCPENCRWATKIQQNRNRRGSNKTSNFKGVSKNSRGTWASRISFSGKSCWLGDYVHEADAAIAYNAAAQVLFGSDAYLNKV